MELPQRLKDSKAAISKTIKMKFFDPYKLRGKLIIFVIGITSKTQRLQGCNFENNKNEIP
ncbi:MAG TPA: hypothetical protein PLX80_12460 [Ignavibacteria bacterium]|nr:hypothetical protein [Ignavibacteria bacterium]